MSASADTSKATSRAPTPVPQGLAGDALGDFVRGLRSYWWLIALIAAGTTAAAAAWTVRQPRIYEAACTIEFDPNPPRPLGHDIEDVASPMSNFYMSREFFATQERILGSRLVAERVVQRLELHRDRTFLLDPDSVPPSWEGMSVDVAAATLQSRVSIESVQGTRLVYVRVRDPRPDRAALIANTLAEVYIEKTLEDRMGSTLSSLEWLGDQLDNLRGQLDASELALHNFKIEHNILSVSLEDRRNLVAAEIEHFNTALTEARAERIALQARLTRVRALAAGQDVEVQAAGLGEDGTVVQALQEALRTKLAERRGLEERYGPNHPQMQALDAQIEALRGQLHDEVQGLVRAADADVREANALEAGLREAVDDAQEAGLELNLREIEYTRLSRERENNEKLYEIVLQRTAEADITRMLRTTFVRLVDRALPPVGYVSPRSVMNVAMGLVVGLVVGLTLAFGLGRMDTRLRTPDQLVELGATILGVLPVMDEAEAAARATPSKRRRRNAAVSDVGTAGRDLVTHHKPLSAIAENFRTIRTNLVFMEGERLHTLAVTSAHPREGKTTITANLAVSLAQSGKRVLIIDTDLRRPRVHRAFDVANRVGVTTYLAAQGDLAAIVQRTMVPSVDVVSSGPIPPNPAELLHRERFKQLLEEARRAYDVVVCDSPPLGAVIDAAVLAPQVDGVLVVARIKQTTRHAVRAVLQQLRDVGANVVGAVVNGFDPRSETGYGAGRGYYYGYYYRNQGEYYSSDAASEPASDDAQDERPDDEGRPGADA